MLAILYYCLKVIICSGVLFGYYHLALRNNRFHQWNRYYLLAAVVVSFTLPLLRIPVLFGENSPLSAYSYKLLSGPELYFTFVQKHNHFHLTLPLIMLMTYVVVTVIFFAVVIKSIAKIRRLKYEYPDEIIDGIHFYNTQEHGTPFSFFKNIFWNSSITLNTEKGQQMLRHEMTHVHEKHSIDKVMMEVVIAIAWWNPFLYYIRKELAVIHEFIADQKASTGDAKLQYASLLLMKAMGSEQYTLGNPFFHSQLKRRLFMLTTSKFPKFGYMRRLIALPLAAMLIMFFSVQCERPHDDLKPKAIDARNKAGQINITIDSIHFDPNKSELKSKEEILKLYFAANAQLPDNALYVIDGKESTKKGLELIEFKNIKRVSILEGDDALKKYGSKGANGVIVISTQELNTEGEVSNANAVFSKAETPASFPGGIDGWRRYLERNLKYPLAAQEKGTQGVVRIQMTVKENGDIIDIKALNDPGDGLASEALRIIKKGPKWVPAKQNGKPVTYQFVQTITFQIQ